MALTASILESEARVDDGQSAGAPKTVLVSDGEERAALAIVRSLGRSGRYHAVVCSRSGRSLSGASRHARADHPTCDALLEPARFARELASLARTRNIDVVLPVGEASILAVLEHRDLFERAIIPFPDATTFRRLSDKQRVLAVARASGIATPAQQSLERAADLEWALRDRRMTFPIVVKPATTVVSGAGAVRQKVGVRHAATQLELVTAIQSYAAEAYPLLLQQRVVGPGVGIFVLRWEGRILATFAHRRLREKPPSGGVSVYSESVEMDSALLERCAALFDDLGWNGVAMAEFKVDAATGTPYLMEINARFWGSLQLAISAGVDFPVLLLDAALNRGVAPALSYRVGVRNRWWWGDVDHLLTRLRYSDEELSLPVNSPSRARAVAEFFRLGVADNNEIMQLDDIRPFLRETALWLQRK